MEAAWGRRYGGGRMGQALQLHYDCVEAALLLCGATRVVADCVEAALLLCYTQLYGGKPWRDAPLQESYPCTSQNNFSITTYTGISRDKS